MESNDFSIPKLKTFNINYKQINSYLIITKLNIFLQVHVSEMRCFQRLYFSNVNTETFKDPLLPRVLHTFNIAMDDH